ncbi:corepressor complex CRC230 [Toxoplasma gondii MAS]|nr:corepressor complex CRC230 [Toxoplasma gondii MAS]PUA85995.1 corepressor complex CRC230 [Toxoplasma gondii TgCATBr9]
MVAETEEPVTGGETSGAARTMEPNAVEGSMSEQPMEEGVKSEGGAEVDGEAKIV